MKKVLIPIGTLYVLGSMFIATDLNPLFYWDWYRNNVNALLNAMSSIHPALPLLWLISIFVVAGIMKTILEADEATAAYRKKNGLCPNCGYDLRTTPNQCSECGTESTRPSTS